jgi:hypothetical protein
VYLLAHPGLALQQANSITFTVYALAHPGLALQQANLIMFTVYTLAHPGLTLQNLGMLVERGQHIIMLTKTGQNPCLKLCIIIHSHRLDSEHRHLQQVLEVIQGEGLLAVVKVMCDWMSCQAPIISACAQVLCFVFPNFSVLSGNTWVIHCC